MHSPWPRAIRSAARLKNPRCLDTTRPARPFHASSPARAAAAPADDGSSSSSNGGSNDSNNNHNNDNDNNGAARDDGNGSNKPEKDNAAAAAEKDRSPLGWASPAASPASEDGPAARNRRLASSNGLQSRSARSRKSDLPSVQLPRYFLETRLHRHGAPPTDSDLRDLRVEDIATFLRIAQDRIRAILDRMRSEGRISSGDESSALVEKSRSLDENLTGLLHAQNGENRLRAEELLSILQCRLLGHLRKHKAFLEIAAWSSPKVDEVLKERDLGRVLENVVRRNEIAIFCLGLSLSRYHRKEIPRPKELPRLTEVDALLGAIEEMQATYGWPSSVEQLHHPAVVSEIITSTRADLIIPAPYNQASNSNIQRRISVICQLGHSERSISRDLMRHVAAQVGADIVHLEAADIAHIVGSYVGQDNAHAPGPVSQLGYTAAENSGRLKVRPTPSSEDSGDELTNLTVWVGSRTSGGSQSRSSSNDDFMASPTRTRNDKLWEDMKINAALEELISFADVQGGQVQNPLIVHVEDFNALHMDAECGATVISKLRRIVDEQWLAGRRIVLVGTCSATNDAPKQYMKNLEELEQKERVIHLTRKGQSENGGSQLRIVTRPDGAGHKVSFERKPERQLQDRQLQDRHYEHAQALDYVRENDGNITKMLLSLVKPPPTGVFHREGLLGLHKLQEPGVPSHWYHSILPLYEVHRIATMMVGAASGEADKIFNVEALQEAALAIFMSDKAQAQGMAAEISSRDDEKSPRAFPESLMERLKKDTKPDQHEQRLLTGLINAKDIKTTFQDVHAPKETIESVKMLTTLSLVRPEAFSYGVLANDRIPGALLYGPPGTGKTLLAKAIAKESGANMIEVSAASINNMYVGESEKAVRALFSLAKKREPMVIFLDEADAMLGQRQGREQSGGRRETINQFLREWDGMDKSRAFILVATNRPFDLDEAVLRRLPRRLLIDLPLEHDRLAILRIHLRDERLEYDVELAEIARQTPMYSGSDLKNVCVAAAMAAVREELAEAEAQRGAESQSQPQHNDDNDDDNNNQKDAEEPKQPHQRRRRRWLANRHFDRALREIGPSASDDAATLSAIRKFDERYGDGAAEERRRRAARGGLGFAVAPEATDSEKARVRSDGR
ncbi:hypothetical protein GGR56DRAFT_614268 [Xylariaceae sp. FL0804]|nr:hypothetical protein GGR56DRAFT_614268 [Xylariaceae sp. FL0804]